MQVMWMVLVSLGLALGGILGLAVITQVTRLGQGPVGLSGLLVDSELRGHPDHGVAALGCWLASIATAR